MATLAVELDFESKDVRTIDLVEAARVREGAKFVWVDMDIGSEPDSRAQLAQLGLCREEIIADAFTGEPATQAARYEDYLHLVLSGCRLAGEKFDLERVDVIVGENFLLTLHRGLPGFVDGVRKSYRQDFVRFARSPSFLVYELWDHLIENYLAVQKKFEERVERMQAALIGNVNDHTFHQVSDLGADILHLRKVVLPARAVLTELGSRRSPFISEATQPFLANMVGTLERVLQDLLVDRDILSESLNLHMSMVGHKTNEVMKRLTVVSIIFLPLTFLCGIYGMNFDVLPELHWKHGYIFFWVLVASIIGGVLYVMRRKKIL